MLKVPIVGTDELMSTGIKQILCDRHYDIVAEATNLKEAVENPISFNADVIILVSQLYKRSDLEHLEAIKRVNPNSRWLAIIPIAEAAYLPFALSAQLHGYISVNVDESEFIKALHTVDDKHYYIGDDLCLAYDLDIHFAHQKTPLEITLSFSKREAKIAWLIVHGTSLEDIAKKLGIKSTTVSSYRGRILEKVNKIRETKDNAELTRFILHYNLLPALEEKFSD